MDVKPCHKLMFGQVCVSAESPKSNPSQHQVKSSHLYLYSAFNDTNCDKATAQYQNGKIVSIM